VAETLDRSRHGVVSEVSVRDRGADLRLQVRATGDAELEVWAGRRQIDVLEEVLGKPIVLAKLQREPPPRTPVRKVPARRPRSAALTRI
jgi:hypothetical protein